MSNIEPRLDKDIKNPDSQTPSSGQSNPIKRKGMFSRIPKTIRKKGRAKGFEKIRDMVLINWEMLSAVSNPLATIKLVLEIDKHAMFAEVAAEKAKGSFDKGLWDEYRDYLQGKIELPPSPGDENQRGIIPADAGTPEFNDIVNNVDNISVEEDPDDEA